MSSQDTLDLTATILNYKADKNGVDFTAQVFALNDDLTPVNLTGFGGVMEVRAKWTDVSPLFTLSVANGKMPIMGPKTCTLPAGTVVGGVELSTDIIITGAYCFQPFIAAADIAALTVNDLVHYVRIVDSGGLIRPYAKGTIQLLIGGC